MTRIVVYELLSAAALPLGPAESRLLDQGTAMRDALAQALSELPGLALSVADSPAAPAHHGRAVRAHPGEAAEAFVRRLAVTHELVWVIAPESDNWLLRCKRLVGAQRWVGSSAAALEVTSHKQRTLAALARAGLRTPVSIGAEVQPAHWVVKPDQGAGAEGCWRLSTEAQALRMLAARRARGESVLCQPWIPGEALSLSLACRPEGCRLLAVNRQQLHTPDNGELRFLGVEAAALSPSDPRWSWLEAVAQSVWAAIPGLRGYVGVDLVWHPQLGPVCIEVNARLTCAFIGLPERLGRPLAAELLSPWWSPTLPEQAHV
ncbi:ATP-grasp domain-containing protein [Ideonella sp. 4Y11]|uniref:ATP-grasp domain-containing protein n=1 Tax=Ideonella aquatica TaxID=2824119 RepID=A0A940YRK1_9BURK|nr:ATP-grasp domain-containing protein [Ideonella aquatica]MBQ0960683.1 ATP-grasp domain-containing protein [Ideonella aquatica]